MTFHSKLSPSASGRWLYCAGSIPLNAGQGTSNVYADQGIAAHALLELCNRLDANPRDFLGTPMYKDHVVDEDMADAVGHALDYTRSYIARHPQTKLLIEQEVDPATLLNCEPKYASGTPDIVLDNVQDRELTVIDYKHGAGNAVEVDGNTQILQYICGYVAQYITRPYNKYHGIIIQPRSRHTDGPVRTRTYTHAEVQDHVKRLRKRIITIRKHPDQREAGDWCLWCAGGARCKTLADAAMKAAGIEFGREEPVARDPHGMNIKQMADVLKHEGVVLAFFKALRGEVLLTLQRGRRVPGFKLVRGRSQRFWKNEKKVIAFLRPRLDIDDFAPRSLVGVQKVEQMLKREKRIKALPKPLATQVGRTTAPLHVAPEDDPREAVRRGQEFAE